MSKHEKLTDIEILKYDVVNKMGRIYTKETVLKMIQAFKDNKEPQLGEFNFGDTGIVDLKRASHETIDLKINENDKTLEGTFNTLDTSFGKKLLKLLDAGEVSMEPRGYGFVNPETKVVEDYELIAFDIVPIEG